MPRFLKASLILLLCAEAAFGAKPEGRVFRIHDHPEPANLDWTVVYGGLKWLVSKNIMKGLVTLDSSLQVNPELAQSWSSDLDHKVFTFKLRRGVKWSDGAPLKAKHFADGWRRVLDPANRHNDRSALSEVVRNVEAPDDLTLKVRLKRPLPFFPSMTAQSMFFPVRADLIAARPRDWHDPRRIVTLGPYRVVSWKRKDRIRLEANPTYWGSKPAIDAIEVVFGKDRETLIDLFMKGRLDAITNITNLELLKVRLAKAPHHVHESVRLLTAFLGFNFKSSTVSDVEVRRAIAHAIDKKSLSQRLERPVIAAESLVPMGLPGHDSKPLFPFDPAKARQILSQSPKKARLQSEGLLLVTPPAPHYDMMAIVAEMISSNLGIPVKIQIVQDWGQSSATNADLRWGTWVVDYPHASGFFTLFKAGASSNRIGFSDAAYDQLVAEAESSEGTDSDEPLKVAQSILLKNKTAIVPLFHANDRILLSERVARFVINPFMDVDFKALELTDAAPSAVGR